MNPVGYVLPAAALGLGALLFRRPRGFSQLAGQDLIVPQAVLSEVHTDELQITEHPVEVGAVIADHAYKRPARVVITCGWSNSPSGPTGIVGRAVGQAAGVVAAVGGQAAATALSLPATIKGVDAIRSMLSNNAPDQSRDIYERLLEIQVSRIPFDVYTGKRKYSNMLFESLGVTTDERTENALALVAVLKEVIIVSTQTVTVPINAAALADPGSNTPTVQLGAKQPVEVTGVDGP